MAYLFKYAWWLRSYSRALLIRVNFCYLIYASSLLSFLLSAYLFSFTLLLTSFFFFLFYIFHWRNAFFGFAFFILYITNWINSGCECSMIWLAGWHWWLRCYSCFLCWGDFHSPFFFPHLFYIQMYFSLVFLLRSYFLLCHFNYS